MNKTVQAFKVLFATARKRFEYFLEGAIIGFTEDVVARMSTLKLSKSDLASRLRCKPSYITKVLRGSTNFTLASMVKIGIALDSEVEVRLRPKTVDEDWSGVLQSTHSPRRASNPLLQWPNTRRIALFNQENRIPTAHEHTKSRSTFSDSARELCIY